MEYEEGRIIIRFPFFNQLISFIYGWRKVYILFDWVFLDFFSLSLYKRGYLNGTKNFLTYTFRYELSQYHFLSRLVGLVIEDQRYHNDSSVYTNEDWNHMKDQFVTSG